MYMQSKGKHVKAWKSGSLYNYKSPCNLKQINTRINMI